MPEQLPNHYDEDEEIAETSETSKKSKFGWVWPLLIFIVALVPRFYFLFAVSGTQNAGPSWYGDVYHHWQIAYMSKEVGFSHGFLRLWDFKGMEYFWGLLHPLVMSLLFTITGSVDILVQRFLSVFAGAGVAAFFFILIRRYFNLQMALVVGLWIAFFPVLVYTDALGMQDQLALLVLLVGLYFWPKSPALTGVFFALASMGRSEYWLFSFGLLVATGVVGRKFDHFMLAFVSWGVVMLLYMKYLLDKTGNAFYPVYWNYLGNAAGEWQVEKELSDNAILGKRIFQLLTLLGISGALVTLWKRPKAYLIFLLGFGSLIFNGLVFGFSAYIYGWLDRYYVDRLLNLNYIFFGFFLALMVVYLFGQKVKIWDKLKLGTLTVLTALVGLQFVFWPPIMTYFGLAQKGWLPEYKLAMEVAKHYEGGTVLIPEDRAPFTYALVKFGKVQGKNLEGQMYDPYAYFKEDPYDNWEESRQEVFKWLKKDNIKLMLVYPDRDRYFQLFEREPENFEMVEDLEIFKVYKVNLP